MEVTSDFFMQLEDLYTVKSRHLRFLNSVLADDWQTEIEREYGDIWEQRGWKFYLRDLKPFPKTLRLLTPRKKQILIWTMIGFANEIILEVSPDSIGDFLDRYIDNPAARTNLEEVFLGVDTSGPGLKAFGSLVVCAQEENKFLDRYVSMLRTFAANNPREAGIDAELRDAAAGFLREIDDFKRYLDSDIFLFRRFNRDLKELFHKGVTVGILGYGEISTVMGLDGGREPRPSTVPQLVYKKMTAFPDRQSVDSYSWLFKRYHLLLGQVGLKLPRHGIREFKREDGTYTVFATQARLPSDSICSSVLKAVGEEGCMTLFRLILAELAKVDKNNRLHPELQLGIDVRTSNWAIEEYNAREPAIKEADRLIYLDTSTPMIRENGSELLDPELFLKRVPLLFKPTVRSFFLDEMQSRYYYAREMAKDLAADFIREGSKYLLHRLIREANQYLDGLPSDIPYRHLAAREVKKRYRRDRMTGSVFRHGRRLERFFQQKVLRRQYL